GEVTGTDLLNRSIKTRDVLALIRDAAARPDCWFRPPAQLTLLSGVDLPQLRRLAGLVAAEARDRMTLSDLPGAWSDLVVMLRMARHLSQGATLTHARRALEIELDALDLAKGWATAPGQTPERLHAAIAAYRDLPPMIQAADVVRAEAVLTE